MKNISILSALAALLMLSSCHLDPPEIPADELFTRSFIKKYGLIDPSQTWNQAVSADVTLRTQQTITSGTVYALSGGKYHKVAELINVSGTVKIPLDVVAGVKEIKMVLDGETYYTTLGGTLDTSDPKAKVQSRTYKGDEHQDDVITITDGGGTSGDPDHYTLPFSQVDKIFEVLPEKGPNDPSTNRPIERFPGNLHARGIKTDFLLYTGNTDERKEITVYPIYWNTRQNHTLGIYYFEAGQEENRHSIVRLPFYEMKKPPQFEDMRYVQQRSNGQAVFLEYPTFTDDYYSPSQSVNAAIETTTPTILSQPANILKWGSGAAGAGDYDRDFYVWHKGSEKRCSDPEYRSDYFGNRRYDATEGTPGVDDYYYKLPIDEGQEGTNIWSNQFRIHLPRGFMPGETFKLSFKHKATHAINNITIQLEAGLPQGGSAWVGNLSQQLNIGKTWGTYECTYTVPSDFYKDGGLVDMIDITLGNRQWTETVDEVTTTGYENIYCFDDIKLETVSNISPKLSLSYSPFRTYRLANDASWDYYDRYYKYENNDFVEIPALAVKKTATNPGMASAHLLIKKTPDGDAYCPLARIPEIDNCYSYNCSQKDNNAETRGYYVYSKGIHLSLPGRLRYGFYIEFDDDVHPHNHKIVYSEAKGNWEYLTQNKGWVSYDLEADRDKLTYCAMFKQKVESRAEQEFTYLTFEDWTPGSTTTDNSAVGDYDLNDLAFMVTGVDIEEEVIVEQSEEPYDFLICAEDLGATDDFDFNDMIVGINSITIQEGSNTYKRVTFRALAAGGTIPLYLHCKYKAVDGNVVDQVLYPDGASEAEWHHWFKGVTDTKQMINTYNNRAKIPGGLCTIDAHPSFEIAKFGRVDTDKTSDSKGLSGIYVTIGSSAVDGFELNNVVKNPQLGAAPQMFLIEDEGYDGGLWQWPTERSGIDLCYTRFLNWAGLPAYTGGTAPAADSDYYWYKQQPSVDKTHSVYTAR